MGLLVARTSFLESAVAAIQLAIRNTVRPSRVLRMTYSLPSVSEPGPPLEIVVEATVVVIAPRVVQPAMGPVPQLQHSNEFVEKEYAIGASPATEAQIIVIERPHDEAGDQLFGVAHAGDAHSLLFGPAQGRQEHVGQDRDDGNYDQKLDQGKSKGPGACPEPGTSFLEHGRFHVSWVFLLIQHARAPEIFIEGSYLNVRQNSPRLFGIALLNQTAEDWRRDRGQLRVVWIYSPASITLLCLY